MFLFVYFFNVVRILLIYPFLEIYRYACYYRVNNFLKKCIPRPAEVYMLPIDGPNQWRISDFHIWKRGPAEVSPSAQVHVQWHLMRKL